MPESQQPAPSRSSGPAAGGGPADTPAEAGDRASFASLPVSLALQLEEVCGRFEAAWQSAQTGGGGPRPEDYLAAAPEEGRRALLRELVRIDLEYRRGPGRSPDPEEYLRRFPGLDRGWLLGALAAASHATTSWQQESGTGTEDSAASRTGTSPAAPLTLPARFGDYELLEEIARGGMGVVYKARQLSLDRPVALKMILDRWALTDEAVQRFHREARAAAALDHPNLVAIHASGQHEGRPFFVMAYVEGDNLRQVVRRDGLPTPRTGRRPAAGRGRGGRLRPPARHHPPRPQAGERADRPPGPGARDRLRRGLPARGGGRPPDAHRPGHRHPLLHVARTGDDPPRGDRPGDRRLQPGRHPLLPADGAAAVQGAHRDGGAVPGHDRAAHAAAAAQPAGAAGTGGGLPALPGEGPGPALPLGGRPTPRPNGDWRRPSPTPRPVRWRRPAKSRP